MGEDYIDMGWDTASRGPDSLEGITSPNLDELFPIRVNENTVIYCKTEERRDMLSKNKSKYKKNLKIF